MKTVWLTCQNENCRARTRLIVAETDAAGFVEFLLDDTPAAVPCAACPCCETPFPRLTPADLKRALAHGNWS
jgi:hypothetical protein